jgi:hypothetical protein
VFHARTTHHGRGGESSGMTRRIAGKVGMTGIRDFDPRLVTPRDSDLIAAANNRAAEHVEGRTDVADPARRTR